MAIRSTGLTVIFAGDFGNVTFFEIVDFSWTYGGGPSKGRNVPWTDEAGSISVTFLSGTAANVAFYGKRGNVVAQGAGALLNVPCVYESLTCAPELNGVTRYTANFTILDN